MSLDLNSLKNAIISLEDAIEIASTQSEDKVGVKHFKVLHAGVIQSFEFTYELCWKFMERWLKANLGDSVANIWARKDLFRVAAENQLIDNVENWFIYYQARNKTSHTYDNEVAEDVYLVALKFIHDAQVLLKNLEARNA